LVAAKLCPSRVRERRACRGKEEKKTGPLKGRKSPGESGGPGTPAGPKKGKIALLAHSTSSHVGEAQGCRKTFKGGGKNLNDELKALQDYLAKKKLVRTGKGIKTILDRLAIQSTQWRTTCSPSFCGRVKEMNRVEKFSILASALPITGGIRFRSRTAAKEKRETIRRGGFDREGRVIWWEQGKIFEHGVSLHPLTILRQRTKLSESAKGGRVKRTRER